MKMAGRQMASVGWSSGWRCGFDTEIERHHHVVLVALNGTGVEKLIQGPFGRVRRGSEMEP